MDMITTATDERTDLYWEAKGSGPSVLLIAGTPGYGGQLGALADELATDHLVITYDRRGTSRSPAPAGWSRTTVADQADDAAAVLSGVGVSSALVFGTSNGALIALELALRHPARVDRVIVHEAPLLTVLDDPAPVASMIGSVIGPAMEADGPRSALEAFLRFAYGDEVVEAWAPELRDRMLADAETVFSVEMPAFQAYRPEADRLTECRVPVSVLVGEDEHLPFFHEAARWLADRLATTIGSAPGAHGPHFSAPARLAATLRHIEGGRTG